MPPVNDNMTQWRECMEKRMDNTASEVSSLAKKIDFLIDNLISKGQLGNVGKESTIPEKETTGITPTSRLQLEPIAKAGRSVSATGARTCSVSIVSQEVPSDGHAFTELGKLLPESIAKFRVIVYDVIPISFFQFVIFTSTTLP